MFPGLASSEDLGPRCWDTYIYAQHLRAEIGRCAPGSYTWVTTHRARGGY